MAIASTIEYPLRCPACRAVYDELEEALALIRAPVLNAVLQHLSADVKEKAAALHMESFDINL